MTLFIEDLSFLFLSIQFAAEIFGGCTNIPCEHPQFFVEFLKIVKLEFFYGSMWSTLKGGSTRYLLVCGGTSGARAGRVRVLGEI